MNNSFGTSATGRVFIPLLFAGDINVYSVARAFHEAYGVVSTVYGKYMSGPCVDSKIIDYHANPKADDPEEFRAIVNRFARKHSDKTVILMGCGDSYVELASTYKDSFADNVVAPYIDVELMHTLIHKERFYEFCQRIGVDYPDTFVHKKDMDLDVELPFDGPYIIKPSNGIEYWRHPYETQKKVYKVNSRIEVSAVLGDIYGSGYDDSVIIQNFIPGDDSYMRVLTSYSDRNGRVCMMCLGHVLLEEHTPHGIGNHAVILTECDEALMSTYKKLLEDLHYVGFSNFDIKLDTRDGKYKAFEINTRQGRSNYYVTGSGANIARYVVQDWLDEKTLPLTMVDKESLWLVVPKNVAFEYIKPKKEKAKMRKLFESGQYVNPLYYDVDNDIKKRFALFKNQLGHYYKYKKYLGKD